MKKIERAINIINAQIRDAEKQAEMDVKRIKDYLGNMKDMTDPFAVWKEADAIATWSRHLKKEMDVISSLKMQLDTLESIAEEGDED